MPALRPYAANATRWSPPRRPGRRYPVMSLAAWTWSCLRPYRGRVAMLATIAADEVALGALQPWPLKLVVDNVLDGRPLPGALDRDWRRADRRQPRGAPRAGRVRRRAAAGPDADALDDQPQVQVDTGQRMVYDLRGRLLEHLQALALRHHVITRTGDAVYRLEADAYCVHDLVMSGLFPLATSVLTLVVMFVDPAAARSVARAAVARVVPFLYLCLRYYSTRWSTRTSRSRSSSRSSSSGSTRSSRRSGRQELRARAARAASASQTPATRP